MPDALTKAIEPLSPEEQEQLAVCESEIKDGLDTFWEVGAALAQISVKRLYREKFETFQIYCAERWHMTRQHAYRLIEASDVFENVSPVGDIRTERQARAIKHFEKDVQMAVWTIAERTAPKIDGKPKISAGHLQAVSEVVSGILLAGGMDDGSGEIKPIGTLLDANVTEVVYERMMRQKEIVREKLARRSLSGASETQKQGKVALEGESQAQPQAAQKPALPEVKVKLLLRLLETLTAGIDKEMADRGTALHPALYAGYHFAQTLLGKEKHDETEMRASSGVVDGKCDQCEEEAKVQDWIFTNTSAQRLSSARLALCGPCVEAYKAMVG